MKFFAKLFFLAAVLNSRFVIAQVQYPTQPKAGYYEDLKKRILPAVPSSEDLQKAKAAEIPAGFKDTLLKYDWYEIASLHFVDTSYRSYFSSDLPEREQKFANNEFKFRRYTPGGVIYDMTLDRKKDGKITVTTTTFNEATAGKLIEVKKLGKKNMQVNEFYGEKAIDEILSYKNGILIKVISMSANPKSNKKFHIAYMAVPKSF